MREVSITVPGTQGGEKISKSEQLQRVGFVGKFMSDTFGGATAVKGLGFWEDIIEDVFVVSSFVVGEFDLDNGTKNKILEFAEKLRDDWEQQCVMVVFSRESSPLFV